MKENVDDTEPNNNAQRNVEKSSVVCTMLLSSSAAGETGIMVKMSTRITRK